MSCWCPLGLNMWAFARGAYFQPQTRIVNDCRKVFLSCSSVLPAGGEKQAPVIAISSYFLILPVWHSRPTGRSLKVPGLDYNGDTFVFSLLSISDALCPEGVRLLMHPLQPGGQSRSPWVSSPGTQRGPRGDVPGHLGHSRGWEQRWGVPPATVGPPSLCAQRPHTGGVSAAGSRTMHEQMRTVLGATQIMRSQ